MDGCAEAMRHGTGRRVIGHSTPGLLEGKARYAKGRVEHMRPSRHGFKRSTREVLVKGGGLSVRVEVLDGFFSRLRGLLGSRRGDSRARPVVITPCASIHTCGMHYPIDVAMLDSRGKVVCSRRGVPPWRFVGCRLGACVLERPSSNEPWPEVGDVMRLRSEQFV